MVRLEQKDKLRRVARAITVLIVFAWLWGIMGAIAVTILLVKLLSLMVLG